MTILSEATRTITLGERTISYRDIGSGPALVFVHGILVNSALWRHVIPTLSAHFRCIAPDLPLGGHSIPMPAGADQSPVGVANLVADLIAALDLEEVTLAGNDTGGAICQLVITRRPERIAGLVLTNCDAYDAFFPLPIAFFSHGPRLIGPGFVDTMAGLLRSPHAQRLLMATVSRRRYDDATLAAYMGPLVRDPAIRRDLHRFLTNVTNRLTLEAARAFPAFAHPVLLVWGKNDLFFSLGLARRMQRDFPDARLEVVGPARAFVPEDQPAALARHILAFAGVTT